MALPDLIPSPGAFCVELSTGPGEICIEFPGGARLCATAGYDLGDPSKILESLLGNANAALMPLQPILDIIDVAKKLFDCVSAIPDALGPPPDPTAILACIPGLKAALDKLLKIIPPIPILVMVKGLLQAILLALIALRQNLAAMIAKAARALAAATRAAELGGGIGLKLGQIVDCANANLDIELENLNQSMAPINRLVGLVNTFLKLAGLDCLPTVGSISGITADALAPLDAAIALLTAAIALIPTSIELPPMPSHDDPC